MSVNKEVNANKPQSLILFCLPSLTQDQLNALSKATKGDCPHILLLGKDVEVATYDKFSLAIIRLK